MLSDPFRSAGALRADYERVDWASTPLGPVSGWSPTLLTTVDLMLGNRFPVTLLWGPELVLVYNQAYVELIARQAPGRARGVRARTSSRRRGTRSGRCSTTCSPAARPRGPRRSCCRWTAPATSRSAGSASPTRPCATRTARIVGVIDISIETTASVRRPATPAAAEPALQRARGGRPRRATCRPAPCAVLGTDRADLPAVDVRLHGVAQPAPRGGPAAPARPAPARSRTCWLEKRPEGRTAWLPLSVGNEPVGRSEIAVRLSDMLEDDEDYLGFLSLVAAAISQAMTRRLGAREAERSLSEALQRSLLTQPPGSGDLQVAVRYQPAAEEAQVGGDWYDAFLLPDGALTMVVGDVAGHDQEAAASMGQLRNLRARRGLLPRRDPGRGAARARPRDGAGWTSGVIATAVLGPGRRSARPAAAGGSG